MEYELLKSIQANTEKLLERLPMRSLNFSMNDYPEFTGTLRDGRGLMMRWSWEGQLEMLYVVGPAAETIESWTRRFESPQAFIERIRKSIQVVSGDTWHDRLGTV